MCGVYVWLCWRSTGCDETYCCESWLLHVDSDSLSSAAVECKMHLPLSQSQVVIHQSLDQIIVVASSDTC